MNSVVLDASAFLAFTKNETGSDFVRQRMFGASMSTVNYAEVQQKIGTTQESSHFIDSVIRNFRIKLVDFTVNHARCVAALYPLAKHGISFADRACIATASLLEFPVVTGDRRWQELELGVEVILFRPGQFSST